MAIVQMQKVAVLAHNSLREEVIRYLHERGVMQVLQSSSDADIDHTEVNFRAAELQSAIQILKNFASKDVLAALQKPSTPEQIIGAALHTDVRGIVDTLHRLEEEDTVAERELQEQHALAGILVPWKALPVALHEQAESKRTLRLLGTVQEINLPQMQKELSARAPLSSLEVISTANGTANVMAIIWKTDSRTFEEVVTRHGWIGVSLPVRQGYAATVHHDAVSRIAVLEQGKGERAQERSKVASELPNLLRVEIYIRWLNERQGVREAAAETKDTVALLGWVPVKDMEKLEAGLYRISPAIALLKVKADEGEEAPVLLHHPKLIAPFISVTTLYGLPQSSEMDPTTALSPFFILFFALCLTDAGYGFVLFALFSIVLLKTKQTVYEAPLLWLLWMSGIVTMLVGVPFGGWFGLTPQQVPAYLTSQAADGSLLFLGQIWNLSQQSGIDFLQNLALALGLTHLFFGMFLAGYHKWVHGNRAAAFWQDFTSHILFAAIVFAITAPLFDTTKSLQGISMPALSIAIALAVWGKGYGNPWYLRPVFGLLGLMNLAIGMLSNGLSYLRILALGLVTGAIALAVNQVAVELGKLFPVWIGIPVVILIFTGGHLVSIALNTLGSFIHSGRLQFIEFFSQFFEGGGKPFLPFRRSFL